MLSDGESEGDDLNQLTINEHYTKALARKKEREELSHLKDMYGSDAEDDDGEEDSEEDESEDEDGEELTPAIDAAILRTLAKIKRKDPDIYNQDKGIFEEEQQKTGTGAFTFRETKDNARPLLMRQHRINSTLKPMSRSPSPERTLPTHTEEQAALRHETIQAFHQAVSGSEEAESDDDDLLVPREKTRDDLEREEEEYRDFLTREVGEDIGAIVTIEEDSGARVDDSEDDKDNAKSQTGVKQKKKKRKKGIGKKETDQEFLMNYILNRGWIDRSARHVPTYSEITGPKGSGSSKKAHEDDGQGDATDKKGGDDDAGLDDDDFDEVADTFESSYNFRFEEPDAAVIPSHPRFLSSLVRRQDTRRKEARERRDARKEEKLLKKRQEVKRMKALKMKELREKLERIGKEGGKDVEAFAELDLEGDWDSNAHDRQMAGIYGDNDIDDDTMVPDAEKPTWDDEININDVVPTETSTAKKKKKKKRKEEKDGTEEGVDLDAMDADIEKPAAEDDEEWDGTEEMRKKKVEQYLDEIYGMEFNDMVGDMPTRFKYIPVQQQSYGLAAVDILMANDADLNQYMAVKKYAPYRKAKWDQNRGERLKELKGKLRANAGVGYGDGEDERPAKKRKGKKERQRANAAASSLADGGKESAT